MLSTIIKAKNIEKNDKDKDKKFENNITILNNQQKWISICVLVENHSSNKRDYQDMERNAKIILIEKIEMNLPPEERTKFTLGQYVNKEGTTIINDNTKIHNDNRNITNNNDYSTNNITNNYNLKVDYLNPITAYETKHMNPEEAWKVYSENCGVEGIGCLIEKLFENDANKNIKLHDDKNYLAYMCRDDPEKTKEHPPS